MRRPENGFMWHWPERLLRAQAAVGFVVRRKRRARGAVVMGTTTTTMMIWNSEGSLPYFGFVLRACGCGAGAAGGGGRGWRRPCGAGAVWGPRSGPSPPFFPVGGLRPVAWRSGTSIPSTAPSLRRLVLRLIKPGSMHSSRWPF